MRSSGAARWLPALALLAQLAGCAATSAPQPAEFLDERTAATLVVVDQPWLLARDRRDVAAHARDYLTLVVVERNVAGARTPALIVHRWSTVDSRHDGPLEDMAQAVLVLVADGRDFRLAPLDAAVRSRFPADARVWAPADARAATAVYPVDAALLGQLAASRELYAYLDSAAGAGAAAPGPYREWRDGRAALSRLLAATPLR